MAEQKLVVEGLELSYEGLFDVKELYKTVDDYLKETAYDKVEKINAEYVKPEGKYIELTLEPNKKISDYVQYRIRMRVYITNLKDVEVEKDGKKQKLNHGKVYIRFDAILETDYEHRWEQRPLFFFLRVLVDKYVYKFYTGKYEGDLKTDLTNLHTRIKAFLNLYRY